MADDMMACEHCDKNFPHDALIYSEGCYICLQCYGAWKVEFDACSHDWMPHTSEMGDAGFYCSRCAGFVATEDFVSLGLSVPFSVSVNVGAIDA